MAAVLGALALAGAARAQTPAPGPGAGPLLAVATIAGRVETRPGGAAWRPATLGDALGAGEVARVHVGGRLTLLTPGGHALRLGPLSQLTVAAEPPAADGPLRVRLDAGQLWLAVAPAPAAVPTFEVAAGPAVLGAFSGAAGVWLGTDGALLLRVYHGRVRCRGAQGGWELSLAAGQEITVPPARAPDPPRGLSRPGPERDWVRWNQEQDRAGGYALTAPR
jgi:ferric-dicitrate binding protein FerR (iron transport regulator)